MEYKKDMTKEEFAEFFIQEELMALENMSPSDVLEMQNSALKLNRENKSIFPKLIISLLTSILITIYAFAMCYKGFIIIPALSISIAVFIIYYSFDKFRMDYFINSITINEIKWDLQYFYSKSETRQRYEMAGKNCRLEYFFYISFATLINTVLLCQSLINLLGKHNYMLGIMFFVVAFILFQQLTCRGLIKFKNMFSLYMNNKYKKGEN